MPLLYLCSDCRIGYKLDHDNEIKLVIFVMMLDYDMTINVQENTFKLIKRKEQSEIIKLNYLPPIFPSNAQEWLDKFLNLKAFA